MYLQENERNVTPYIYIGFVNKEIDVNNKSQIREYASELSTDQIIYYKSQKKADIILEFVILL